MLKNISLKGRFALLTLLAACFTGCTSVPMPKGTSKGYSSVRFIAPNKPLGSDNAPIFIESNQMIKEAVSNEMKKNGLTVVDNNADLIIAHLIILQDNSSTSYSNQHFGLQDFSELVDLAHKEGMKKHFPERVLKRALVIDLIDAKTNQLVYRDYVVSGTLSNLPAAERQAQIQKGVSMALKRFFE
ncbi:DUF4136 domain-containing protein [Pontiellaceae bacterium B12227]|nr:DUF4136 domain-containing protein [Pontiellaceae bacterium B12227]